MSMIAACLISFAVTALVGGRAILPALRSKFVLITVVAQCINPIVRQKNNIPSLAAIASVRPAVRDIFFTAEADMAASS